MRASTGPKPLLFDRFHSFQCSRTGRKLTAQQPKYSDREYREALSGEQRAAIGQMPSELKAPCDLANHVYSPTRHLAHGFPVRLVEFDPRDPKRRRVTELKDFRTDLEVPPDSFALPEGFRRMNIRELQKR